MSDVEISVHEGMEWNRYVNPVEVLITAGGTSEPIDDVRRVTNISSGRLGHALARHYARLGWLDIELMCPDSTMERFGDIEGVRHTPFRTTDDLRSAIAAKTSASLIYHSAAVSDYAPLQHDGKIDSRSHDELTIRMQKLPKLLASMREQFGEKTTIVGFKLLSHVHPLQLLWSAGQQINANKLDYCVANRLEDIQAESRCVYVAPRGVRNVTKCEGSVDIVASKIANAIKLQK